MPEPITRPSPITRKRWLTGRCLIWLSRIARTIPGRASSAFGQFIGNVLWTASPAYRRMALMNLRQAFGSEWTEERIRKVARESFRNMGKSAVEFIRMPGMSGEEIRKITVYEGREYLDAGLARGKGCLLITAHFGNWEIMAARVALDGYPLGVISRDADDPAVDRMIQRIREGGGYTVFSRNRSMIPVMRALRHNECIGILPDQNTLDGIFVPFFGKPASTVTGPAALARASGAAVIPAFSVRQPDGIHRILIQPELPMRFTADKDADIRRATEAISNAIEQVIRLHPTQWLWIHNRWKRQPAANETDSKVASRSTEVE